MKNALLDATSCCQRCTLVPPPWLGILGFAGGRLLFFFTCNGSCLILKPSTLEFRLRVGPDHARATHRNSAVSSVVPLPKVSLPPGPIIGGINVGSPEAMWHHLARPGHGQRRSRSTRQNRFMILSLLGGCRIAWPWTPPMVLFWLQQGPGGLIEAFLRIPRRHARSYQYGRPCTKHPAATEHLAKEGHEMAQERWAGGRCKWRGARA